MYWVYSALLSSLSLFCVVFSVAEVSGNVIALPHTYKNNYGQCRGSDNCGSGTTYCDTAFHKLVADIDKSEIMCV